MNFVKNILVFIFSIQEKMLMKNLTKTIDVKNISKRKKRYSNGCLLTLNSLADDEKNKLEEEITLLLKNYDYNPQKVLEYIKYQGTNVHYMNRAFFLKLLGEQTGFIYPQTGIKACLLSLLCNQKITFKTDEMFVLIKNTDINKYYFIYYFYNWYAFKHGIEGVDTESYNMLQKYLFQSSSEDLGKLQLADIYKLKNAIKQDTAAIMFVIRLCQKYEASKEALQKLQDKGANI